MKNVVIIQNVSLDKHLGPSTYLRSISKYLSKDKDLMLNLIIIKSNKGNLKNINFYEIDSDLYSLKENLKFAFEAYKKLKEINNNKKIDVIHCLYPNSALTAAVLFKKFVNPGIKIVYDIRSPWIDNSIEKNKFLKKLKFFYRNTAYFIETTLCKYVDSFIFITEGLREFYKKELKRDFNPSIIILSGVDTEIFNRKNRKIRDKYNIKKNEFLLGYIGAIKKERELDFVINSFNELQKKNSYKLMMVGEGDDKERLKQLINKLKLENKIIFLDAIPYEEVPYYNSAFDAGICHLPDITMFRNSFPMKILEYTACETPVLASNIKTHNEIKKDLKSISIYNSSILDKKIKFNQNDLKVIKNKYDWKVICKGIKKIY